MLKKFLFLLVLVLIPLTSALTINDTLYINSVTKFSAYVNETITVQAVNLTDSGRIEFFSLDTTKTIGKFYNINETHDSVIDIFGLVNALIYYGNGTILKQQFTGDINISLITLTNVTIMNNYNITLPNNPSVGDPLNQGGGGGGVTKINNSLLDPLLVEIFNLNNSFIYLSNGTVLRFTFGEINITLSENEFFYIVNYLELLKLSENSDLTAHDTSGNSNDGTISGATWDNDNVDVTLTEDVDYTITNSLFTVINTNLAWTGINLTTNYNSKSNKLGSSADNITIGVASFFGNSVTWFSLLAIVVTLLIIAIVILTVKRFEGSPFTQVNSGTGL